MFKTYSIAVDCQTLVESDKIHFLQIVIVSLSFNFIFVSIWWYLVGVIIHSYF